MSASVPPLMGIVCIPAHVVRWEYENYRGAVNGWIEVDIASREHHRHEHRAFVATPPVRLWLAMPPDFDPDEPDVLITLQYKRTEEHLFNRMMAL